MLNLIDVALGKMLGFLSFGGSYALGLLFYALIFKIAFVFFAIKQQKNQIKMAKLAPKIAIIRAKYKGRTDAVTMRKQQEEIMKLQQDEGYSPLAGCLPLLIQMPLIILLYRVIQRPLSAIAGVGSNVIDFFKVYFGEITGNANLSEIELAGHIKSITSVEGRLSDVVAKMNATEGLGDWGSESINGLIDSIPNFNLFGLDLTAIPKVASVLVILPLLVAVFQWLSMFVMRKVSQNPMQMAAQDENVQMSMKMMDLIMPLMTLFFAFKLPAIMGLYWIYQSIFGMIQSIVIAKLMPIPKYTEDELKVIEKARRQQEKAQKEIIKTQPKYKSLHYIDDDDYEDLPEVKTNTSNKPKPSSNDKPEKKD
jgi:YidC/Oxa1 family membrane protein insertase